MLSNILASAPLPAFGSMVWIIETRISETYVDLDSIKAATQNKGVRCNGLCRHWLWRRNVQRER